MKISIIEHQLQMLAVNVDLQLMERMARTCMGSTPGDPSDSERWLSARVEQGHEGLLEHGFVSIEMWTSRAVTHELVRHRHASFLQQSQRYVDFSKDAKYVQPSWLSSAVLGEWTRAGVAVCELSGFLSAQEARWLCGRMCEVEEYRALRNKGLKAEDARDVLSNAAATRICCTMNLREVKHVLNLRCRGTTGRPLPAMSLLTGYLAKEMVKRFPLLFAEYK